ncbi:uncharacterized protein LOC118490542 [Helianthus annuus]|uniref:uncharacterized protein LOC118490542 n=1 Tax=Helianthus annuus TaxID=4232 RepID=UPI001653015B|nr:uncharacterized protein LOC118490542 [Helianthus annuus]
MEALVSKRIFFTLNASTITLIAIAMKLPMDLTTDTDDIEVYGAKFSGIGFLITMLANFLPSLGLMDDKELLMNIAALGILSFLKRFKKNENTSNINESSEIEEYTRYAIQIDEDERLSNRLLRNTLHSITKLINASEEKEPHNLIMLLEKSIGFNGVVEFDNNEVPSLYPEEIRVCWSLVLVTLTTIAIALPNIGNDYFKRLLSGLKEGLQIVSHIEECLYVDVDSIKARKAAMCVWTEVEIYHTWLKIHLRKKACKENTSKEILKWLGDEAAKIVIQFKSSKKTSIDQSPNKLILAGAMYKISQTILLYCHGKENWPNNEELLEWISTITADVLAACFTNLPHVIKLNCHHHAIEKRGDDIQNAAQLLGKSKKILKILEARQLPDIDRESMACTCIKSDELKVTLGEFEQVAEGKAYKELVKDVAPRRD